MKKLIENNKKITAAVLALILGAAAVFGIAAAVRATTSSTVMVVRASELNYGEYLDWQNSVAGMITTDAEQDVYLSDTEVVEEVLVAEGQSVHKGDVLMRYDTTSTKLSLEKEKINYEKLLLQVQVAEENLRKLQAKSPVSDGDFGFIGDFGEYEAEEQNPYTMIPRMRCWEPRNILMCSYAKETLSRSRRTSSKNGRKRPKQEK